jgi:hypothetical protein
MARWLLIAALVLVALVGVSQLVIPPVAEHRIEDRLTDGGGTADVSLHAFPAARLLFGDGTKLSVRGSGLDLGLEQQTNFALTRPAPSAPYHLVSSSRTTPGDLASYGAARLGLPGGPLLRFFTDQALGGNRPIPIHLDMELRSDGGRVVVVSGGGTVAGYPTGPLAELITSTIAVQL